MADTDRKATLAAYAAGELRVVVNVAVLTEGWDHPPTSCVVLLRPSSYKSTMIQMVGRGLRTVSPEEHPGVIKTDCIVLDFGTSTLLHGSLEQDVDLDGREPSGEAPTKDCPDCGAIVPLATTECPLCGHEWLGARIWMRAKAKQPPARRLRDDRDRSAEALELRVGAISSATMPRSSPTASTPGAASSSSNGRWHAVGRRSRARARICLGMGERTVCLAAADDWLNEHESDESAHKSRRWLNQPPTDRQLAFLPPEYRQDFGLTRYQASALLAFRFNKRAIRSLVFGGGRARSGIGRAA